MAEKFIDIMNKLALPVISDCGCEFVDSEFVKEGGQRILRFYIEKTDEAIGLDDCAAVSRGISALIDSREGDEEEFVLEVSSPGVNRILKTEKDYARFSGSEVDVSLYRAIDKEKKFVAVLIKHEQDQFTFKKEETEITVADDNIAKINLHFDFKF